MPNVNILCKYYLDCLGTDQSQGVSALARSFNNSLTYVALTDLPQLRNGWPWWLEPGVAQQLNKVQQDPNNLIAWLGYPIRLRAHQTANWNGFFLEPCFLWSLEKSAGSNGNWKIADERPIPNLAAIKGMYVGDTTQAASEVAELDEQFGVAYSDEPIQNLRMQFQQLRNLRPDWDWQEDIDPDNISSFPTPAEINTEGIFNRAVIIIGKRSPFTKGLESELKRLTNTGGNQIQKSSLGAWVTNNERLQSSDSRPIIEVVAMNEEQRKTVRAALSSTHTVVTGPPGTGKSQVVTNLLVNAAWRGMKVLFASKNNKAVDVVEERVNRLADLPLLLRTGSTEYQAELANYMTTMLAAQPQQHHEVNYDEAERDVTRLSEELEKIYQNVTLTIETKNKLDNLSRKIESSRGLFDPTAFNAIDSQVVNAARTLIIDLHKTIDSLDTLKMGFWQKIVLLVRAGSRRNALVKKLTEINLTATSLNFPVFQLQPRNDLLLVRDWLDGLDERVSIADDVVAYQQNLDELRKDESFESLALRQYKLSIQLTEASLRLWKSWVALTPARLSDEQRVQVGQYSALLQAANTAGNGFLPQHIWLQIQNLQNQITHFFSCWAVTSLSARGRIPLESGFFDLVVIDEASQCDIASALPLLYRAKRAVIIGDPKQLKHIASLSAQADLTLMDKYNLRQTATQWMYSVNSLFDLSASLSKNNEIFNLRDHYRCHSDIIEFSNREFYNKDLRVVTRHESLNRPVDTVAGIFWKDVSGFTVRPSGGGAFNEEEADAVLHTLERLLLQNNYRGSVGIVTPFRAQVQLITELLSQHQQLKHYQTTNELIVQTANRFQGDERDVIIFSPVISRDVKPSALKFLQKNGNLFNVAITRARAQLIVVGDYSAALTCGVSYYENFARYVESLQKPKVGPLTSIPAANGESYPSVHNPHSVSEWEKVFYRALYKAGISSIPQYTIEQYDLDFAIVKGNFRLNVEIDGEIFHKTLTGERVLRDRLRDQRLMELGWEVKRFWVYEIRDRLAECVDFVKKWTENAH